MENVKIFHIHRAARQVYPSSFATVLSLQLALRGLFGAQTFVLSDTDEIKPAYL